MSAVEPNFNVFSSDAINTRDRGYRFGIAFDKSLDFQKYGAFVAGMQTAGWIQ